MKTPACLPTLVLAVALALGLVAILLGPALAADGIPGAAGTGTGTGTPSLQNTYQGPAQPQGTAPNENYRANYHVDYHATTGNAGTQGAEGPVDSPANIRDSIGRRDFDTSSPFSREMSRFRGEMSTWRPGR